MGVAPGEKWNWERKSFVSGVAVSQSENERGDDGPGVGRNALGVGVKIRFGCAPSAEMRLVIEGV